MSSIMTKSFTKIIFLTLLMLWWGLLSSSQAYIAFSDSRSLYFDSGEVTLYIGQQWSSLYLDSRNTSWKPLSCQIEDWNQVQQRNNCDDISFSTTSSANTITIHVQLDNDQATFVYDTSTQKFTSAHRGVQNMTNTPNQPTTPNQPHYPTYPSEPTYSTYLRVSTDYNSYRVDQSIDAKITLYQSNGAIDTSNRDTLDFELLRKTNGNFYSVASRDYSFSRTSYQLISSDRGSVRITNLLRIVQEGDYILRITNRNTGSRQDISLYITRATSSQGQTTSLNLSLSTRNPSLDSWVDLTLEARDRYNSRVNDYNGRVRVLIERRENNSSYRSTASSRDYDLSNTEFTFTNQNGRINQYRFIRFSRSWEYRVRIVDMNNSSLEWSQIITVQNTTTSQPSSNSYVGWTSPAVPTQSRFSDLVIETRGTTSSHESVQISLERKRLPESGIRTTVGITRDCQLSQNYITLNAWQNRITNAVRCDKKWFYRVKLTNNSDSRVIGYIYFTIVDTNDFARDVSWFTRIQREEVQRDYENFMNQVNQWNAQYPTLSTSTRREALRKEYYVEINKITYAKEGRLSNYNAYISTKNEFNRKMRLLQ